MKAGLGFPLKEGNRKIKDSSQDLMQDQAQLRMTSKKNRLSSLGSHETTRTVWDGHFLHSEGLFWKHPNPCPLMFSHMPGPMPGPVPGRVAFQDLHLF